MKSLKTITRLIIAVIIVSFFVGCSTRNSEAVYSYDEFIEALQLKGYQVKEVDIPEDQARVTFFSEASKYIVDIGDNIISVYEFSDSDTATSKLDSMSHGRFAGISRIKINFYCSGRIIVTLVSSNKEILADFKALLGEPVTRIL